MAAQSYIGKPDAPASPGKIPTSPLPNGDRPLRIAAALDYEPLAIETLRANLDVPTIEGDIRTVPTRRILRDAGLREGEACLVVGGPPCTPFSKSGYWLDYKREDRDPDASLLDEYARVVEEARPEAFVLENVQGLTYRTHARQNYMLEQGWCSIWEFRWWWP